MAETRTFADRDAAAFAVAEDIAAAASEPRDRPLHLALSGGSSPGLVFNHLKRMADNGAIAPERLRLFWIDERCVGLNHARSNAGLAKRHLGRLWDRAETYRMKGELGPVEAAAAYENILSRFGGVKAFDMALLGVGPDGHVASLFPDDAGLTATGLATPAMAPDGEPRVSVTFEVLAACPRLLVLAWGAEKAPCVHEALTVRSAAKASSPFARACGAREGVIVYMDEACANPVRSGKDIRNSRV